jgi:UDP-N-acetylmuramoyl-tripeptide--D-alanyl-D-alanine ligase
VTRSISSFLRGRRLDARSRRALERRLASSALFIGVTGSSAKSTTTALLAHILKTRGRVCEQADNNIRNALLKTLLDRSGDSDFVVAELGVGRAGSMRPMAEALRPDVAVITLVGLEHYSVFRTREAVAMEKGDLVESVRPGGFAVLNADDRHVMSMAARTAERIVTFGRTEVADFRAVDICAAYPDRLRLTLEWRGQTLELKSRFLAEHFWLSVAAASAAAIEIGVPPAIVAQQVASFEPIMHRFGLLSVPNGPDFIVDTVKAPWHSLQLAFDAIAAATAPRKRIVLGQMSDFSDSNRKYRDAYLAAQAAADQVMFVGDHSHRSKASKQDRDEGRFAAFTTPWDVAEHIRKTAIPGELILLKGSSNLHLERIALSWVDDVKCWVPSCGKSQGCEACGLYKLSYEVHRGHKTWRRRNRLSLLFKPWKAWARTRRERATRAP